MIDNFKEIIAQLKELSSVVNSFKSEAVQIRLVELVFSAQGLGQVDSADAELVTSGNDSSTPPRKTNRKRRSKKANGVDGDASPKGRSSSRSGRVGGKVMLGELISGDFFKTPKTIGKIVEHLEVNKALHYKQSDFSGALGRAVRDGALKRKKNAENQYEYTSAK